MQNTAARKIRQVPEGYLIIGIDPHKKKHAAVAITQDLSVHDKFKFDNTMDGFDFLLKRIRAEMVKSDCRGVMFAIETGGHYWRNIAYFLDSKGIPFRFINQYTLKRRREGKDLNHRKNDYRDSEVAAQLLCTGEFVESGLPQGVYAELRTAHNAYRRLVKERTRITNLIKGLLDGLFPEFVQVFKDPCAVTALCILSCSMTPSDIAGKTLDEFRATIEAQYQGHRLMRRKLALLHQATKTTTGISAGARSVASEIGFLVEKFELIKKQIRMIDKTLVGLVDQTEEGKYLLTITGLNYIAVAGLIAELGCFKAYRTAKQMIKMAGSNPTESESAGKKSAHTPMSKQGRPVLRYCAWTAVIPMLRFNTDFRTLGEAITGTPSPSQSARRKGNRRRSFEQAATPGLFYGEESHFLLVAPIGAGDKLGGLFPHIRWAGRRRLLFWEPYGPTRVHNMVPLPSWPTPYEV